MPATLLRVTMDARIDAAENPSTGGSTDTHAPAMRIADSIGGSAIPDRLISGSAPMTSTPAARLLTARIPSAAAENNNATATFPAKISFRLRDRVSSVVQVP